MALHNAITTTAPPARETRRHRRQSLSRIPSQSELVVQRIQRLQQTTTNRQQLNANDGLRSTTTSGSCQYYHKNKKYPMARRASAQLTTSVILILSFVCLTCSLASQANQDRSGVDTNTKQRQPPAIYSYSAGELDEPSSAAALGPLTSHRLNRPYSWTNQRLAKLMSDNNDDRETDEQAERSMAAFQTITSSGGGSLTMGDSGDQTDLSLLYAHHHQQQQQHQQQTTKTKSTKGGPVNRWPALGNRRRRPQGAKGGTKRVESTATTNIKGTKSARPETRGWQAGPAPPSDQLYPSRAAGPSSSPNPKTNGTRRASRSKRKNLVCYYGTWAVYRPDGGKFAVEDIDPFLCTHVIYGFTGLSYDNLIKPLDPWNDLEDNYGKGAMKRFTNLKRINPDLKTLVAIGGWNEGSIKYSKMASDPEARARFVDSVVNFLAKYNFDGLDLDWEYPGSRGGASYDKQNFVKLLRQLHEAFKPRQYLLTAAVSAGKWFIDPAYDIPQVSKYLDLINLMAYDYHGGWESKTGMNAPLFSSRKHDLSSSDQMLNVNWSVNYWLQQGAPREKLMLGVGSYGRSFTLDKEQVNGINAPASQKGRAGPYTREPGSLGYNELCEAFKRSPQSWTIVRDPDYLAPYAYNRERQWVGYDDQESLALKAQFAKSMGLGGMMMWSIETDDFRGSCHSEKFPLLNTIRRVMDGQESGAGFTTSTTSRPATGKPATTGTTSSTTRRPAPNGGSTNRPAPTAGTSTKRPGGGGHEVEEVEQPKPVATSSTRRPQQPTASVRPPRPPPAATSARPQRPSTVRPKPTSTTTTSTTSTTTTQRPTTASSAQQEFTCREAGMFADPQNCRKFIRCVQMEGAQIQKYNFDCPPGTAYKEEQQYCDHLHNVPECTAMTKAGSGSSNRWQRKPAQAAPSNQAEVEEVLARASSLPAPHSSSSGANNYPQSFGQPLIPLIAVAGPHNHYPVVVPQYMGNQLQYMADDGEPQSQMPLIVKWR
uniref:chitinase n=1 Tax=Aceria tosichella TaxID=561515 RepID=A0A6G1S735_9ACAR